MPGRKIALVTNQTYHVLNRGAGEQPIFWDLKDYERALETILYYRNISLPLRYSIFTRMTVKRKKELLDSLAGKKSFLIDIVAYCLMPNHIHFLVTQRQVNGISKFMSNFSNSYTRYFNTRINRRGPIFQGRFKAIRIKTDEQLLHVSRYIHLNPYVSYIITSFNQLERYPYSSLGEYTGYSDRDICQKKLVLDQFPDAISYKEFVFDQANYQRELEGIKHLTLEE